MRGGVELVGSPPVHTLIEDRVKGRDQLGKTGSALTWGPGSIIITHSETVL